MPSCETKRKMSYQPGHVGQPEINADVGRVCRSNVRVVVSEKSCFYVIYDRVVEGDYSASEKTEEG